MTKAEKIRQELVDSGATILDCPNLNCKSIVSPDGFIGTGKINSQAEEHSVLAHDKWHLKLGAFYTIASPFVLREQMEYKVKKRALMEIVPLKQLKELLLADICLAEIAEILEVTQNDILQAYLLYRDLGLMGS